MHDFRAKAWRLSFTGLPENMDGQPLLSVSA